MDDEIKLSITGLVYNQSVVGTYGLVMSEAQGYRRFSVMIGEPEAQSIALKLNNKVPARPLTHDLIKNLLSILNADLEKVLIYDMINDVFYSELHINKGGEILIVDARTSDAVALAVRCECPIYIKSDIMDVVGTEVPFDDNEKEKEPANVELDELNKDDLISLTLDELNNLLAKAVDEEQYELAVLIRDAINKKSI